MPAETFIDTNVLIYAVAQNDPRNDLAEELLAKGCAVSVQVLNEFVSVARRKLKMSWKEVDDTLSAIRALCSPVLPITIDTHDVALHIAQTYGYEIYDALVLAAALEGGCTTLFSEDLHHGHIIDGKLTIRNPFRSHHKDP